jgi:TolB-like protein/DNA-binding winged helix-turn-helix (wHTH) protein/tetratricopeptide (TPR) repeat protein
MDGKPASARMPIGYRVGDLLVDMRLRRVTRDGIDLGIVGRSFELLVALAGAAPRVVANEELMDRVWAGLVVNPETLTQRVKLLRKALADDAEHPRYVAVLRGFGYRIAATVETLTELPEPAAAGRTSASASALLASSAASTSAAAERAPAPAVGLLSRSGRRVHVLGALLPLLVAGAGVTWWALEHRNAASDLAAVHAGSFTAAGSPSVAVLPFANLTGAPTKDYLGEGIAEELIDALAHVPGLKVPAPTSTFAYKGRDADVRRIARDLGVTTVLEGSVRSAGERLRISARLVDAASGYQIWSQEYDRQSTDIFALQGELAAEIVQALRRHVSVDLPALMPRRSPTRDVQAYDLYLQAEAVFRGTPASAQQAIAFLDQALARDPDFADALAHRAALRIMPVMTGGGSAELLDEVGRDAVRALAMDPTSAEGHATREMLSALHGDWLDAEREYEATMSTGANDPYFRDFHSFWLLRPAGRLQQDESELLDSYRLAPAHGFTLHELATTESLLGQDAEAVRYIELFHELVANGTPVDGSDALPYVRRALRARRYDEVARWATLALSEPLRRAGGTAAIDALSAALADPAEQPNADRALRSFVPQLLGSTEEDRVKMFFVDALVMVGDVDGAYDTIERFLDRRLETTRGRGVEWSEIWAPEMRAFRQDPRFGALVARLGLVDYWRRYGAPDECSMTDGSLGCR